MKVLKKRVAVLLAFVLSVTMVADLTGMSAAAKTTIKNKKITMVVGQKKQISLKNKVKKAKYLFVSSNKKTATVSSKGVVSAKKAGTVKIAVRMKAGKKVKKIGSVTVKISEEVKKVNTVPDPTNEPVKTPEVTPQKTPERSPEGTPQNTPEITPKETPDATPTATPKETVAPTPKPTVPADYVTPADYRKVKTDVVYGEKKDVYYESTTTGTTRHAYVVLPAGYTEEKEYPVLYLLHGIGGDENEWFGGNPNEIVSNLIAAGEAEEMILVFPNVRCRANDSACYDLDVEHFAAFDNFINDLRDNLMPYIQEHYSVAAGRENTAVAGLSMGGRESLYIGLSMPETFGYIGAFEPAVGVLPYYLEDGLFTEETMTLPDEYKGNTFLMIVKGQNDTTVGENPLLYHNALVKNGVEHIYYDMPGNHDFSVWSNGLYNFAKRIFK